MGPLNQSGGIAVDYGKTESYTYRFINCTRQPVWLVDGTNRITMLTPIVDVNGNYPRTLPPDFIGRIVAVACKLVQDLATNADTWVHVWSNVIATPPTPGMNGVSADAMDTWISEIKEFNMVLFGNERRAQEFVSTYGNYFAYVMRTDFGTRFANSANYGILNCTSKTLFQVDDTAIEDCGQSDIIEIPAGKDAPLPLWDNQNFNTQNNVRQGTPYVRAYRYAMVPDGNGQFRGFMREHIYNWTPDTIGENGFLYIPYHHMCLFDDRQAAEQFVRVYKTVERYHMARVGKDMEEKLQQKFDAEYKKQQKHNKRVLIGCAIILSLQIATKLGEIITDEIKKKKKTTSKK